MQLREALQVCKGDIVALVGAGGKTSAMYRLANELAQQGCRVVTTTTTMIRPPTATQTQELIVECEPAKALQRVEQSLQRVHLVTLASQYLAAEDKLKGIDIRWVAPLTRLADVVIVEADGARGLPLKAPAIHEPVVPSETTLFISVVGVSAVGSTLTEGSVHRSGLISELVGLPQTAVIDAPAVANLLVHPSGGLKGAPARARVVALINQVRDERTLDSARQIALRVKRNPRVERVLLSAVATAEPVVEVWQRVSAIVLAAGASTRLGRPKQLLPVATHTMIEHVIEAVKAASFDEVIVVLGSSAAQISEHVPADCRMVLNPKWQTGVASSIRAGLAAVRPRSAAALFVQADQPHLNCAALDRILYAYYGSSKTIVVPTYQGQRGSPVLFDRSLFPELEALSGDVGGRAVVARFPDRVLQVEMPSAQTFLDIDTPADYEHFLHQPGLE